MKMQLSFLIAGTFLAVFSTANGQDAKILKASAKNDSKGSNQPIIIEFKDTEIDGREILSKCEQMSQEILQANKVLDSGALSLSAMWFNEYSNHPKIEEETNIRREWFKKLAQEIEKLQHIAYKIECAKEEPEVKGHDIVLKKGPEKYKQLLKTIKEIADKPDRASKKQKK